MIREGPCLYRKLEEYSRGGAYPFHMPGHKRRLDSGLLGGFPNPYGIDITEIEGFDNLHHPEGILRESMDWAARVYGADRTYYLVNGSSCGVLAAVCAAARRGPEGNARIIMARNSHRSAYHAAELSGAAVEYIYPRTLDGWGLQGGLPPEELDRQLRENGDAAAVFVVSPTYDGVVSDIRRIAGICHRRGVPLIVDEAHGAHFPFGEAFPSSALEQGADIVVQSLHKTLPAFTQTAVLHVKGERTDRERLEHYLRVFQSSSPSYVLMAGIERCIGYMDGPGRGEMREFAVRLGKLRENLSGMRRLLLLDRGAVGRDGVYDLDASRLVISTRGTGTGGGLLAGTLRERYHLEMEMWGADSVTAIATLMDSPEGLKRLETALLEIDAGLAGTRSEAAGKKEASRPGAERTQAVMTLREAADRPREAVRLEDSAGRVSAEYVYPYPPGIPVIVPGEILTPEIVGEIVRCRDRGLPLQGLRDHSARYIGTVREREEWEK